MDSLPFEPGIIKDRAKFREERSCYLAGLRME